MDGKCFICSSSLIGLNPTLQQQHINRCLDRQEKPIRSKSEKKSRRYHKAMEDDNDDGDDDFVVAAPKPLVFTLDARNFACSVCEEDLSALNSTDRLTHSRGCFSANGLEWQQAKDILVPGNKLKKKPRRTKQTGLEQVGFADGKGSNNSVGSKRSTGGMWKKRKSGWIASSIQDATAVRGHIMELDAEIISLQKRRRKLIEKHRITSSIFESSMQQARQQCVDRDEPFDFAPTEQHAASVVLALNTCNAPLQHKSRVLPEAFHHNATPMSRTLWRLAQKSPDEVVSEKPTYLCDFVRTYERVERKVATKPVPFYEKKPEQKVERDVVVIGSSLSSDVEEHPAQVNSQEEENDGPVVILDRSGLVPDTSVHDVMSSPARPVSPLLEDEEPYDGEYEHADAYESDGCLLVMSGGPCSLDDALSLRQPLSPVLSPPERANKVYDFDPDTDDEERVTRPAKSNAIIISPDTSIVSASVHDEKEGDMKHVNENDSRLLMSQSSQENLPPCFTMRSKPVRGPPLSETPVNSAQSQEDMWRAHANDCPDYRSMKLPELKMLMKAYGFKTAGVKKQACVDMLLQIWQSALLPEEDDDDDSTDDDSEEEVEEQGLRGEAARKNTTDVLHARMRAYIRQHPSVHAHVLLFQPLELHKLIEGFNTAGIVVKKTATVRFLDSEGIGFKETQQNKTKNRQKKPRRRRK